ncbi:hypothetical protein ACRS6Y_15240 [Bacillus cytotoxicus]|uniref:hypothetical protein n=1 Tax=Bacillus cytotoxicus TaxID=580165 RepID=UPI003D7C57F3
MDAREFQEMPLLERAEYINKLLLTYDEDPLRKAAEEVNMKYSAFCKEMRRGGFTYNQGKRQYEKTLSVDEYKDIQISIPDEQGNDEALLFIKNHLNEIKELLSIHETQLVLDPKVYDPESESLAKSLVVNKDIYDEFSELCKTRFPHLRLNHILSNCLYSFVKQHRKTPS